MWAIKYVLLKSPRDPLTTLYFFYDIFPSKIQYRTENCMYRTNCGHQPLCNAKLSQLYQELALNVHVILLAKIAKIAVAKE